MTNCIDQKKKIKRRFLWSHVIILVVSTLCCFSTHLWAGKGENIAVLPFTVHRLGPPGKLPLEAQEMLIEALTKRGYFPIPPQVLNRHPNTFLPMINSAQLVEIGRQLGARWIVKGSITQIGQGVSLDLKVVDRDGKRPAILIYVVAEGMADLKEAMDRAAASIHSQIIGLIQVDMIKVAGNQRIGTDAILAVIKTKQGQPLDSEQLDEDLRNIYKMGYFKDVQIETEEGPKGKIVTFRVKEKPSVGRIRFSGNKEVEDDELRKEVGIRLYSILSRKEIKESVERLREFYRQKGYYNVEIDYKVKPLPQNEVSLTYLIREHKKVHISKIEFEGNEFFDDDELKDLMETREKGIFSWITGSGYLDKKKLEFDIQKIAAHYHNHGFIKAKVGEPQINYQEGEGLRIVIEISEGERYRVRNIRLTGELIGPEAELLKSLKLKKGDYFNREIVRKDILSLRNLYADEGFAYAEVKTETQEHDKENEVDITFKISHGPKVRFERINIEGNTVTRDKVVRRALKVVEGDYFSATKLRKSTANLYRLGYFEDLEVHTRKGSSDEDMVLDIKVKERPTGSFSLGAGYSSVDKAMVMFRISQNNLFGYGQRLSASAQLSGKSSEFDISFVEPWLFDKPLSLSFRVYKWEREYDEYTKDSWGSSIGLGFPLGLDEYTRGSVKYAWDRANVKDISETASTIIKDMAGRNVTSSVTLGIRRDSKDRPWNTRRGSVNSLTFEYAGGFLGGDIHFNKYLARSTWYFPVLQKSVFVLQGRWGYVSQRGGDKLPGYQKFRIGGLNTVRGFNYGDISPVDPATGDRIGGEKMMIYNVEFRFPLLHEAGLVGLVFFDAGNVFTKDESYTFSDIKRSVGLGIRWYSPVGPLRLEYGKVLNRGPEDPSGNWEFSIGGLF